MSVNRIVVELDTEDRGRLDAEGRRRGLDPDAVLVELVRALPPADAPARTRAALAALRELRSRGPVISEAEFEAALRESREDLERRTAPDPGS